MNDQYAKDLCNDELADEVYEVLCEFYRNRSGDPREHLMTMFPFASPLFLVQMHQIFSMSLARAIAETGSDDQAI